MIYIRGCFDGIHGYGAHIRSHLRLLEANNIDFRLIQVKIDSNVLDTDEIRRWRGLVARSPEVGGTVIHFCEAPHIVLFKICRNISYTMWETDRLPNLLINEPSLNWVSSLNNCDEVWTGSEFAKSVFFNSGVKVPIFVVPWAVSPSTQVNHVSVENITFFEIYPWRPSSNLHRKLWPIYLLLQKMPKSISSVSISFGYFVFEGMRGFFEKVRGWLRLFKHCRADISDRDFVVLNINTFNERKNLRDFVAASIFSFAEKSDVTIILKTYHATNSWWIQARILSQIQAWADSLKLSFRCRLLITFDPLNEQGVKSLISSADIFFNTSKGEGIGGGVLQAMSAGVPAVTHLFSSFSDFCSAANSYIYDHSLEPVQWNFDFYGMGQMWARVDMRSAIDKLREAYHDHRNDPRKLSAKGIEASRSALEYGDEGKITRHYRRLSQL